jgi:ATP-dependent Zn protease
MKKVVKYVLILAVIEFAVLAFQLWQSDRQAPLISRSRFASQVADGQVSSVSIFRGVMYVRATNGGFFRVIAPPDQPALIADLQHRGVTVWIAKTAERNWMLWSLKLESKLRFGP